MQIVMDFTELAASARAAGLEAGERSADRAEKEDPLFRERALAFIVTYIRQKGEVTGESATLAAVLSGIKPKDQRAFGPVYQKALRENLIRVIGYVPRVRGHGSAGGKLYAPGSNTRELRIPV